jgi:hypothetical protein
MEPKEINVTPEMIEAGIQTLWARQENASSGELVEAVFLAMLSAAASAYGGPTRPESP